MLVTKYNIAKIKGVTEVGVKIALLSDLHNRPFHSILEQVKGQSVNMIAVSGDVTNGYEAEGTAVDFLRACAKNAPTFVSLGNHDSGEALKKNDLGGCVLLDDEFIDTKIYGKDLRIGGLSSSPYHYIPRRLRTSEADEPPTPNTSWIGDFCKTKSYKLLLCHQPEYYKEYLKDKNIDLVLSGHAHGGQWRIPFIGQGIYAPGQGFFPRLTSGVIDGRLVISRGLANTAPFPRFFNRREIVVLEI